MITIAAGVIAALLVHAYLTGRDHTRHIEHLIHTQADTTQAFIAQVDRLCQRIQAPEQAVIDHTITQLQAAPPPVPMDDDKGYDELRGLTKDELADMVAEAELRAA